MCREACGAHLRAVGGQVAQLDHPQLTGDAQDLDEQGLQGRSVDLAEIADGAEVGPIAADDSPEGQVALARRGEELLYLGVVADALHAEHLRGDAAVRVAAPARARAVAEDARGEVGLGVEGTADPDEIGVAGLEDVVHLGRAADAADGEHRDAGVPLDRREELAVPHRCERRAGARRATPRP